MKSCFGSLLIFISLVVSAPCVDQQERLAERKLTRVYKAFEKVSLPDQQALTPHAILYDGNATLDVFLTFTSGYLEFRNQLADVPKKGPLLWQTKSPYVCHLGEFESNSYQCESVQYGGWCLSSPVAITKTWQYDSIEGDRTIFATDNSAIFRLYMPYDKSDETLESYITDKLSQGFSIVMPQEAQCVTWASEPRVIDHIIKTQRHRYIRYNGASRMLAHFKETVEACRQERAQKSLRAQDSSKL